MVELTKARPNYHNSLYTLLLQKVDISGYIGEYLLFQLCVHYFSVWITVIAHWTDIIIIVTYEWPIIVA